MSRRNVILTRRLPLRPERPADTEVPWISDSSNFDPSPLGTMSLADASVLLTRQGWVITSSGPRLTSVHEVEQIEATYID